MISDLKYFLKHASNITSCGKLGFTFVLSANVMITFVCKHMKDMYKKHMKFNLKVTMINLDYRGGKQRQHESSRFTLLVYFGEGPKRETHVDKNVTSRVREISNVKGL